MSIDKEVHEANRWLGTAEEDLDAASAAVLREAVLLLQVNPALDLHW